MVINLKNMLQKVNVYLHIHSLIVLFLSLDDTTTEILNPLKQFTGVFQSTIGSYRLLYGAEMDCVVENAPSTTEHIELKVCAGKSLDDLPLQ